MAEVRTFGTGATRDQAADKLDYEGFFSPLVLRRFAQYMHGHRLQPDGQLRESDSWQLGIPKKEYLKSAWRHFFDWWQLHRGNTVVDARDNHPVTAEEAICALLFNAMGYLHELLKGTAEASAETPCLRIHPLTGDVSREGAWSCVRILQNKSQ